jgi:hypothetical protein
MSSAQITPSVIEMFFQVLSFTRLLLSDPSACRRRTRERYRLRALRGEPRRAPLAEKPPAALAARRGGEHLLPFRRQSDSLRQ